MAAVLLHTALCLALYPLTSAAAPSNSTVSSSTSKLETTEIALISVAIGCVVICWGMKRYHQCRGGSRGVLGAARWRVKGDKKRVHVRVGDIPDDEDSANNNVGSDGA